MFQYSVTIVYIAMDCEELIVIVVSYEPSTLVTEILKILCSHEQTAEICLYKDEITTALLSPVSQFLDTQVYIPLRTGLSVWSYRYPPPPPTPLVCLMSHVSSTFDVLASIYILIASSWTTLNIIESIHFNTSKISFEQ